VQKKEKKKAPKRGRYDANQQLWQGEKKKKGRSREGLYREKGKKKTKSASQGSRLPPGMLDPAAIRRSGAHGEMTTITSKNEKTGEAYRKESSSLNGGSAPKNVRESHREWPKEENQRKPTEDK